MKTENWKSLAEIAREEIAEIDAFTRKIAAMIYSDDPSQVTEEYDVRELVATLTKNRKRLQRLADRLPGFRTGYEIYDLIKILKSYLEIAEEC